MKYQNKFELKLTLFSIFVYYAFFILGNIISNNIFGIEYVIVVPIQVILFGCVLLYLKRKNLLSYYGVSSISKLNHKKLLFYVPFIIITCLNFMNGITIDKITLELFMAFIAMFFTGFFEELLFRSFLVRLLLHKSKILAIVIPSLLFGIVHLFNLLGGADIAQTLLQVCYASAFGFMCTAFFYKTDNIIPCMICHSLVDMVYVITPSDSVINDIIFSTIVILLGAIYGIYLMKNSSYTNLENI